MLIGFSVALIKHQYQKQFEEEKGLFELTAHSPLQPIVKRGQGRPVRQESASRNSGRPLRTAAYCLLPRLMLLSHTSRAICSGVAPTTGSWASHISP